MIYIFTSLYYFVFSRRKSKITSFLFLLLIFTSIAAYLVGRQPIGPISTHFYTLYTAILLYVLFRAYASYGNISSVSFQDISQSRLKTVEKVTTIFGVVVLLVYVYILSQTFTQLLVGSITAAEHKNEGGAELFWSSLIPHSLITLGNFVAPIGYLFMSLHFYYLIKNDTGKALRYFILSLVIVLNGLIALSRSATVQFLLEYAAIFLFVAPLLNKKIRKRLIRGGAVIMGVVVLALFIISQSRFEDYYTKQSKNEAIVDETEQPVLFSTLDYFAQWEENGPIIMQRFEFGDQSWGIYNCSGLAVHIQKIIYGSDKVNAARENKYRGKLLKEQASYFHGLVARLIYDFGFIGSVFFIIFYAVIIKRTGPKKGELGFKTLLALPVTLPLCTVFWAGNTLASLPLDLAIIYNIAIYYWIRRKPKKYRELTKQIEQ